MPATDEMQAVIRNVYDKMSEVSSSTKLAEEYHCKLTECLTHIDFCVPQLHGLIDKLSTQNVQFGSSGDQSLSAIRSSVGSLASADSRSRQTDFMRMAAQEVEQIKAEQLQLCRRCDRLLAIFKTHEQTTQQTDDAALQQILNIAADEDGASAHHAPDTSGTDANANQGMATQAGDSSVTVPSSAGGFGPSPSSGVILYGGGSDSSFVDSTPRSGRSRRGRGARFSGRVNRAVMGRGGKQYSTAHRTANDQHAFLTPLARPTSSLDHEVVPSQAKFRSTRGRARGHNPGLLRKSSRSAEPLPRDVPKSTESRGASNTLRGRRSRRGKSAALSNDVGNNAGMMYQDNGDGAAYANSTDDASQSAVIEDSSPTAGGGKSALVKARSRKRAKSATLPLDTRGAADDQLASSASVAQPTSSLDHGVVPAPTEFKTPRGRSRGRTPGRRQISSRSVDTLPRDVPDSTASSGVSYIAADRSVNGVAVSYSTNDTLQSAIVVDSSPVTGGGEAAPIKAQGRRGRTKSAVLPSFEKTSPGQTDGTLTSAVGQNSQLGQVVPEDVVVITKSARQRSSGQRGLFYDCFCHFCVTFISVCYHIS